MIDSASTYADELNVYADEAVLAYAHQRLAALGRHIPVSVYLHLEWGGWPADLAELMSGWHERGVQRVTVSVGLEREMAARVRELADAQRVLAPASRPA